MPIYSVDTEEEARLLLAAACELGLSGDYIAKELVKSQTIDNLYAFGRRLAEVHARLKQGRRRVRPRGGPREAAMRFEVPVIFRGQDNYIIDDPKVVSHQQAAKAAVAKFKEGGQPDVLGNEWQEVEMIGAVRCLDTDEEAEVDAAALGLAPKAAGVPARVDRLLAELTVLRQAAGRKNPMYRYELERAEESMKSAQALLGRTR